MDRVRHAAQVGDINELYKCIQDEVDVRTCINVNDDDDGRFIDATPLHIAVMRGHVDFAMALIYLKPSWGRKLNHQMYTPMHLAVLHEHDELVLALLAADKDLVRVKGQDGYTALHYAAEKGKLEVLAHFLKDCLECLEDVTIRNETALHVTAQNGKLEALQILARYIRRVRLYSAVSKKHLLKDRNGDSVLHIAASNTQPEMIEVLLECKAVKKEINKGGLAASNLLERQSNTTSNREKCLNLLHNGCLLLAMQVIQPNNTPTPSWKMRDVFKSQLLSMLYIIGIVLLMEFVRRFFHYLLYRPPVYFFRRFFRNQIQM